MYRGVGLIEDTGDVGDEYNYCPPAADRRITSADARPIGVTRIHAGPLRTTFLIELELSLPAAATSDRRSRDARTVAVPVTIDATLDAGSPRVTFAVTVDNSARDHRLRMLFPTGAARVDTSRADTAFDVVTRPARREVPATIRNEAPVSSFPMISVVDAGDSRCGAIVVGNGLMEYEVVELVEESYYVALTLIRAVGDLSRNDLATRPSGHAGPPVATPAAQCRGRHRFAAAFEPRAAAPSSGQMLANARAATISPRVVAARIPGGTAPVGRSFLSIDRDGGAAILSALKKAEDREAVVVRLFNPDEIEAEARIATDCAMQHAYVVNLLEERQSELPVAPDGVRVRLMPHQILTLELVAARALSTGT